MTVDGQVPWNQRKGWSGRRDSNSRPPAPKEWAWFPIAPSFTSRFHCFQQDRESAFRSKANPSSVNRSGFGTVLPQFDRCVANRELTRGSTLCIREHNPRPTTPAFRVWSAPVICCSCSNRNWSSPNGNSDRQTRFRWSGRSGKAKRRIWDSLRGHLYSVDSR